MLLYVDDTVTDATPFGDVRSRAYKIIPKADLQAICQCQFNTPHLCQSKYPHPLTLEVEDDGATK